MLISYFMAKRHIFTRINDNLYKRCQVQCGHHYVTKTWSFITYMSSIFFDLDAFYL